MDKTLVESALTDQKTLWDISSLISNILFNFEAL